jgi:hypothetical protein
VSLCQLYLGTCVLSLNRQIHRIERSQPSIEGVLVGVVAVPEEMQLKEGLRGVIQFQSSIHRGPYQFSW